MITAEGPCTATDFLSELVGKPIEVLLVNRQEGHRSDRQSGILTRVYSDAILPGSPATSSAGSSRNDLPAKYIGE
jgi:hypothetical protein